MTTTQPTDAAMRAAQLLYNRGLSVNPHDSPSRRAEVAAAIIDAETGLPELIEACRAMLGRVTDAEWEEHDDPGEQAHDPEMCAVCMARAAIAKAENPPIPKSGNS